MTEEEWQHLYENFEIDEEAEQNQERPESWHTFETP
jgi:hypothetical protein